MISLFPVFYLISKESTPFSEESQLSNVMFYQREPMRECHTVSAMMSFFGFVSSFFIKHRNTLRLHLSSNDVYKSIQSKSLDDNAIRLYWLFISLSNYIYHSVCVLNCSSILQCKLVNEVFVMTLSASPFSR